MSSFGRRRLMPLLLVVCGFLALPGTALGATILDAETGLPASGAEIPVEATFSWQTAFGGFDECSVDSVLVVDESAEQASLPGGFTQEAPCTQGTGQFTGCTIDSTETPEGWTDFDSFGLGEGFSIRVVGEGSSQAASKLNAIPSRWNASPKKHRSTAFRWLIPTVVFGWPLPGA